MKKIIIIFVILLGTGSFYGQETPEKQLSLKDAIIQALKNNLDLQIQVEYQKSDQLCHQFRLPLAQE